MSLPPTSAPRIQFLGTALLQLPGQHSTVLAPRDAVLLAHLALHGAGARDALAALLWQDREPAAQRANLRQRIKRLQDASGQQLLALQGDKLALGHTVEHDLATLAQDLLASPQAAPGALLGGLQLAKSPTAALWLDGARLRVHAQRLHTLRTQADALEHSGQLDAALAYTTRLLAEEPMQEHGHRQLMRLHHLRGEKAAALAAYQRLCKLLSKALKQAPDEQTQALARLVESAQAPAPPRAPTSVAPLPHAGGAPSAGVGAGAAVNAAKSSAVSPAVWAALLRPPKLLQREAEWQQLSQTWTEGGICIVLGEAGMGKTRLLNDFADSVSLPLRLRAQQGDHAVPYALLSRWITSQLSAVQTLPDWARSELAHLAPELGPAPPGKLTTLRLVKALALLQPPAGAVLLDDLHHADEASLELLPAVLQTVRCSLLGARGDEMPAAMRAWIENTSSNVAAIKLGPWPETAVAALLVSIGLQPCESPPLVQLHSDHSFAQQLFRHTGGHPFLVLETLRAVLLGAQIDLAGAPLAALPMPPQVKRLVGKRLQRLSPGAQQVAQLASLAGAYFGVELALRALACGADALASAWTDLQRASLMTADGLLHDLVLQVARESLSEPMQRHWGAALAEFQIERQAQPARIASSWSIAGRPELAAHWHEQAVAAARSLGRRADMLMHWEQAESAWLRAGQHNRAFQAGVELVDALVTGGHIARAIEKAKQLQAAATCDATQSQAARVHALALLYALEYAPALERATFAHAAAARVSNDKHRVDALVLKAWAAAALNRAELALACIDEERQIPFDPANWQRAISRLSVTGVALLRLGRVAEGLQQNQHCVEIAKRPEARTELLMLLANSAAMQVQLGDASSAVVSAQEALRVAAEIEETHFMPGIAAAQQLGLAHLMRGEYGSALHTLEGCLTDLKKEQLTRMLDAIRHQLARLWMQLGQTAKAQALLGATHAGPSVTHRVRSWALRAELAVLCGAEHPLPDAELPLEDATVEPTVAALCRLAQAATQDDESRWATAHCIHQDMSKRGLMACALLAQVAKLAPLRRLRPAEALVEARKARNSLQTMSPLLGYWPQAMWEVHQALAAGGATAEADVALEQAWNWVQTAHDKHVPDALRAAFMSRNKINAKIALARRKRHAAHLQR